MDHVDASRDPDRLARAQGGDGSGGFAGRSSLRAWRHRFVDGLGFKSFWPGMADNPAATPDHREISQRNNAIDKVVVSDSFTTADTAPRHNTSIVRRAAAHAEIAELKGRPGNDILTFGSRRSGTTYWRTISSMSCT
jgi:hypothetical protein